MKKATYCLLLNVLMSLGNSLNAQTSFITIGTGTSVNSITQYPAPYGNYYWGAKHQMIIRASELTAAGMTAGYLYSLAFNVSTVNGTTLSGFTISLKNSSSSTATTTFQTGLTTVYGPQNYTETTGWNTHNFTTPFYWDGTSNLLVETCFNNSTYSNNARVYYTTASFTATTYYRADVATVCSSTTGTTSSRRPNMKIEYSLPNLPPNADFTANVTSTCTGNINFTDNSTLTPTSWKWNFGDGTSDTIKNPSHNYSGSGNYTVTLIATNSFGSDTMAKPNYILVNLSGPTPACSSKTTSYCCGFGITNVTFGTINNNSLDAVEGYKDFTCTYAASMLKGSYYPISVTNDTPVAHNTRAWIDYNNDGAFDPTTELILSANSQLIAADTVLIPATAVLNIPLRMRVSAEYDGFAAPSPCTDLSYGQAEDYSVTILENTFPPIADFVVNTTYSCDGVINFLDISQNAPVSWFWDFGDGTTDVVQNPVHSYTTTDTFSVTLIVSNIYGNDTIVKSNYIITNLSGQPAAAACTPNTLGYCCGYGINNVSINTLNNATGDGSEGYGDFTCTNRTTLKEGKSYIISITTGSGNPQDTKVWIDYNNNGSYNDSTELVLSVNNAFNPSGSIYMPVGGVLNTPLRMRISSDFVGSPITSCSNLTMGQAEDYTVSIQLNTDPPAVDFVVDDSVSCGGVVSFTDLSVNLPTSWLWKFGDGTTDTAKNPTHTYTSIGLYTVTLIATNAFGTDSLKKTNYVNVISTTGGPQPPSCIPGRIDSSWGMGIYNVTLNTINNNSTPSATGYTDYSCQYSTNLTAGQSYAVSVETNTTYEESVLIWIDYDNNGVFNVTTEQAFSSINLMTYHTGTILIPGSAVTGQPLRMRVGSDYGGNPTPTPCNSVDYGEFEDYSITVIPNTNPPVANFIADKTLTCNGTIQFTDMSLNIPTSWLWSFGDGTSDTVQNPLHNYTSAGTYSVKLKVTNIFGSDSLTKTNYITVSTGGPKSATCTATELNPPYGLGIYVVTFNTINNNSGNGDSGYVDFSCSYSTTVTAGQSYSITVETGPTYEENVRAWIDYNNDGAFDTITEKVFSSDGLIGIHSGNVIISGSSVLSTPLRMRVASDYMGSAAPWPCKDVDYGEFEDYSVTINANTNPPVADFIADKIITCNGIINFTDNSLNVPTSWNWEFGDGATSTLQNPSHTYTVAGTYSIKLTVTNTFGSNALTKTNYITISTGGPISASCTPIELTPLYGMGIYSVAFNTFNNNSAFGDSGYVDYSCQFQTTVTEGQAYSISVETNPTYEENVRVWIDYNNDGSFDTTVEKVFSSDGLIGTHSGTVLISGSSVLSTALRMRVASDYMGSAVPAPCQNVDYGEFEDYSVIVNSNSAPPIADFSADKTTGCSGIAINFTDKSYNVPASWQWDFGDGFTSTVQNPSHTYASTGIYTVFLIVSNSFGSDTISKMNYITIENGPVAASCITNTATTCCQIGIYNVVLGTINNTSGDANEGYQDFSCSAGTYLVENQSYNISIETSASQEENVRVWVDYNNDGTFSNASELVFSSDNVLTYHNGAISIPGTTVQNVPLRMRVISAGNWVTISSACITSFNYGQSEDYRVTILPDNIPPIANYTYSIIDTCQGVVEFVDQSMPAATSWLWNFGDGTSTSTTQNPYHTFSSPGTFNINLIVSNNYGSDTIIKSIVINSIKADFISDNWIPVNTPLSFTDNSPGATSWLWNFGDGYSAALKDPVHTYSLVGTYTVTLKATNTSGCYNQASKQINVTLIGISDGGINDNYLNIYPSPTDGLIYINYSITGRKDLAISIVNILGEEVYNNQYLKEGINSLTLNLSGQPKGIYFIKIYSNSSQLVNKVILK